MTRKQSIGRSTSKAKRLKKIASQVSKKGHQEDLENRRIRYAVTSIQEISHLSESKDKNNSNYTFYKGIKFNNQSKQLSSLNLCYINTIINALLNCKSITHLLKSNENCEVINNLKYWIDNSDNTHCTESLRELVIRNGYNQFSNQA